MPIDLERELATLSRAELEQRVLRSERALRRLRGLLGIYSDANVRRGYQLILELIGEE
jgi:hypothetical protein